MSDLRLTRSGEFMVTLVEGLTEKGVEWVDAYLGTDQLVVADSGRIVIPSDEQERLMGEAKVGDVALVENVDTGFRREVKVDKSGRYKLRNLPTGTFRVTVKHPDGSTEAPRLVTLRVGSTARVQ